MNKKVFCLRALIGFLVILMAAPAGTIAQTSGTSATFTQEELDQMLAPIALYPDSLLAQILVAATFSNEVMEADQWVKQNEDLKGNELNAALDKMDWDLSVKALVPFPKVLSMMNDKREWTQRLGDAFLAQQTNVMVTIQSLRAKAHAQGNLKSTNEQKVVVKGECIEIHPANRRVVYVPAYNPSVVYGTWWHPAHLPYAYNPYYPGYVYDPYYTGTGFITAGAFGFAAGIAVGSVWNSGWGRWDWGHRDVHVNITRNININRNDIRVRNIRTTNLNHVVNQRRIDATERARLRTSGQPGAGVRPSSAASVRQGHQQRQSKAQMHKGKRAGQGNRAKMHSTRSQLSHSRSSGKSHDRIGHSRSSGKSHARIGHSRSSARSHDRIGHSRSSGKSHGSSHRGGGSSHSGRKSHGGGGGSHGKHK